jgi:DtxR family Mn-dependent transcriptional regulator
MLSRTEENYIKAIFKISEREKNAASTNSIAGMLNTSAASVSDMLKKLQKKEMIHYEKYRGVTLTARGNKIATKLIRKHRLWEVFLVKKLKFSWDQVHNIAEELEHIPSEELINRLDNFLDNPRFDPHGDPIPNIDGKFTIRNQYPLSDLKKGDVGIVLGVKDHSTEFLQYLNEEKIKLGSELSIVDVVDFDGSMEIIVVNQGKTKLSNLVTSNLLVKKK